MDREFALGISVVIPTEGRVHLLKELLLNLQIKRAELDIPSEVLVVDSSVGLEKVKIIQLCDSTSSIYIEGSKNVREKRNQGILVSTFKIILFLDSDIIPKGNILQTHWDAYKNCNDHKVASVLGPTIFTGDSSWFWDCCIKDSELLRSFSFCVSRKYAVWGPTANISYLHTVLEEMGGFDTKFPFRLGCDDVDLGYRVTKSGYKILCEPKAVVFHSRSTWNKGISVINRSFRWGRMQYHLFKKHPKARITAPPSFWGWSILILVIIIAQSLISKVFFPHLFVLWVFLSLSLFSLFSSLEEMIGWRKRVKKFFHSFLMAFIELPFSLGETIEFLLHFDFRFLYSKVVLDENDLNTNWKYESWNALANFFALLVCEIVFFAQM